MIEHYIQHHENEPAVRIDIDLSLAEEAPDMLRPLLLWVFIKIKNPDASGLCAGEECGILQEIREKMSAALHEHVRAVFSGSRMSDGWFELFFYARSGKKLTAVAGEVLQPYGNYAFDTGSSRDEKWEHYENELYPDTMMQHQIQNRRIIEELVAEGDDIALEREVEHYLFFQLASQADKAVAKLEDMGYSLKESVEQEGDYPHGRVLVRQQNVTEETMQATVGELLEVAYDVYGTYEGWSTVIAES